MESNELPQDFISDLAGIPSDEKTELLAALREKPTTSIRLNPLKEGALSFPLSGQVPWHPAGYYLNERPKFTFDPLFHTGAYYVQEASSMSIGWVLEKLMIPKSRMRVLDASAAPGGKTGILSHYFDETSLVLANEIHPQRARILEENVVKSGFSNTWVSRNNLDDFEGLEGYFDLILLDAPCSGEGMFRKDAFAREQWNRGLVQQCASTQKHIIQKAYELLKEDGILLYSTCTFNPQENEQQFYSYVEKQQLEALQLKDICDFGVLETEVAGVYSYRFMPHRVKGEGFCLSVFRKKEPEFFRETKKMKKWKIKQEDFPAKYLLNQEEFLVHQVHDTFVALPKAFESDYHLLNQKLNLLLAGIPLATAKKGKLIPHPYVAFSVVLNKDNFQTIESDREEALAFLRLQSQHFDLPKKGYTLATFKGLGLGWINHLGNRSNNYYPKNWRIRN